MIAVFKIMLMYGSLFNNIKRTKGIYTYWNVIVNDNLSCVVVLKCPTCIYKSRRRIFVKIMNGWRPYCVENVEQQYKRCLFILMCV